MEDLGLVDVVQDGGAAPSAGWDGRAGLGALAAAGEGVDNQNCRLSGLVVGAVCSTATAVWSPSARRRNLTTPSSRV